MSQHPGPTVPSKRRAAILVIGAGLAAMVFASACGSGSGEISSTGTEEVRPTPDPSAQSGAEPTARAEQSPEAEAGQPADSDFVSNEFDTQAFAAIKPGGPREVDPRRFRQLLERDRIVPIYEPLVVSADETEITPDELVMGVSINGEARAYPIGMMRSREIANDELGGVPILVTW